jgi:hypothetical protein
MVLPAVWSSQGTSRLAALLPQSETAECALHLPNASVTSDAVTFARHLERLTIFGASDVETTASIYATCCNDI